MPAKLDHPAAARAPAANRRAAATRKHRRLSDEDRERIRGIIQRQRERLESCLGFVGARPGFRIQGGVLYREPSVVAYVTMKLPAEYLSPDQMLPAELEGVPVDVVVADPATQLALIAERSGAPIAAAFTPPRYKGIAGDPIDKSFTIEKPLLCHVGPDAGWVILRDFLAGTKKGLTAAMYDFNAGYIADTLISSSTEHDFPISLAIDNGLTESEELPIQKRIRRKLRDAYDAEIIYCRAAGQFPSAYHEKVAVRDEAEFWLSSGNWTRTSQPEIDPIGDPASASGMYSKGNREWHVVVADKPLAKLFARYIEHDRSQAKKDAAAGLAAAGPPLPDVFVPIAELMEEAEEAAVAVPQPVKPGRLPQAGGSFVVRPVLSPDNYAARVTELIRGAKKRLYLQLPYITWSETPQDQKFRDLLEYVGELSWRDDFDLKIIIGSRNGAESVRILADNGLNEGVFRAQARLHNKGIVADGKRVLISSQNWSGDGFLRNRDAGLIVDNAEVALYYERVFLYDWDKRAKPALREQLTALVAGEHDPTPPGMVRMRWNDYYED
jgi:hypothetical protein